MTMGKKRGLKIALIIILLLVANAGAFAWIGVNFVKEKLDKVVKLEVDKSKLGIDPRVARELKNYRNIVLLGIDTRDVKDDKDARSDTIVIASIDKRTNKVRLTSVYRDCCLMQEQRGPDKINHAYFYALSEVAVHSKSIEEVKLNATLISEFFNEGWKKIRGI